VGLANQTGLHFTMSSEGKANGINSPTIESKEVLEMLAKAFSKLDVNKDGTISKQEFVAGVLKDPEVQKILHIPIEKTTAKTPESRDAQGVRRGSLKLRDKDVLRRAVRTRNLGIALKYFKQIDKDNSGTIDVNEFSAFFHSSELEKMIGQKLKSTYTKTNNLTKEDARMLKQMFEVLDSDESGLVSYVELCEGMGPQLANEMFSTMDEDGNKYLEFDEILMVLDQKFKGVAEQEKLKRLGKLAQACIRWNKRGRKLPHFARTKFVPDSVVIEKNPVEKPKRSRRGSLTLSATKNEPIPDIAQDPPKTDLVEAYIKKAGLTQNSPFLSGISGDPSLGKLSELKELKE